MTQVCLPRYLPRNEWVASAQNAIDTNPENRPKDLAEGEPVPATESGERLAIDVKRYWGRKGVKLTVGFIDTPDQALRKKIIEHLNAWNRSANVTFTASDTDPQVRIARFTDAESGGNGGYWSYLGTDVKLIGKSKPTMNLQAFTMQTPDSEFHRVVRHEAGHTLGFPHEHMRKDIIQRLDREKVISSFMASQGWSRQEVINQILTPLEETPLFLSPVIGTLKADQTSIMCYQIEAALTKDGKPVTGGDDINETDHAFAALCYPKAPAKQP
jgi:hypothetical protein